VTAAAAHAARCDGPRDAPREGLVAAAAREGLPVAAVEGSVLARVARERREAHEPPEARGLRRDEVRMLVAAAGATGATGARISHARARDLPDYLRTGDVLVVNTSKTLPAALPAVRADGTQLRLHLSTPAAGSEEDRWVVELRSGDRRFGGGLAGERLGLPGEASATLLAPYLAGTAQPARDATLLAPYLAGTAQPARDLAAASRGRGAGAAAATRLWLATIDTRGTPLHDYLGRHGAPIRYAHTRGEHPLDAYQTIFALHPGSAEMPSAGRVFTPELVTALVARGVVVAPLTLHAGVSSLEAGELPYPERFAVPATTARLVNAARAGGGRVIAVGTTVVRALETVALPFGHLEADAGWTRHVVTPECGVRVVDGLLTGWHDPDASHLLMLEAIGGRDLVEASYAAALDGGYRWHEFGDVHLILP
jgi:S-adenosylmethionine:tRNA ribosyltransferase-isomerase